MPVLFVYIEGNEKKQGCLSLQKFPIKSQFIWTVLWTEMIFFFFCFTNPRLAGQRAIEARCILAGEKGKPLIINSPFCPCFTTCKDSKRINFGRACKIAIPGIATTGCHNGHRAWQFSPHLVTSISSCQGITSLWDKSDVRRENARCSKRFPYQI